MVAPAGTLVSMAARVSTVKSAAVPLNVILVAPLKFVPAEPALSEAKGCPRSQDYFATASITSAMITGSSAIAARISHEPGRPKLMV